MLVNTRLNPRDHGHGNISMVGYRGDWERGSGLGGRAHGLGIRVTGLGIWVLMQIYE